MILQISIIFVGKSPFHVVNDGLTLEQWGICIGFSAITFVVSALIKFLPIHVYIDNYLEAKMKKEEKENEENEKDRDKNNEEIKQIKFENGSEKSKVKNGSKIIDEVNNDSLILSEHNGEENGLVFNLDGTRKL